jgi:phosphoglycerate dehydrogenase-like enzyme
MADKPDRSKRERPLLLIYLPHRLSIWRLPQLTLEEIRRRFGQRVRIETPASEASFVAALPDAEVLFTWGLARRHVAKAGKLRWLHTPLAGVDRVLNPELVPTPIRVTSSRGVNSVAVAEHALAMALSMTRGLTAAVRAQVTGRWAQNELYGRRPPLELLQGKVLGIYGMGDIGRELATRAQGLGMKVWGLVRRPRPKPEYVDRLFAAGRADTLLRGSDLLVLALPLTPATQGLIGERQLKRMKPSALFINVGRGELVQQSALIRALREGWIAGAALDVFESEPLARSSPLWNMPQVVISPHIAGTYPDYMARAAGIFMDNMKRYLAARPLLNEVDKSAGY